MNSADIRHSFRSDIQGLRGVAVIFVIIGHVYPSVLPGGFIGVDAFFVISGYVITEQLKSLWLSNQKNLLASFYTRRILRIFPSALIVVSTTVLATRVLLGPVFGADTATDGFWSTVFLANFHFAALSQDYFASGVPQSAMQHYWSLSIEEQFYLLWPLIFIVLAKYALVKRYHILFVGALLLGSFAFCIANLYLLNGQNFFNSGARAWQLLAGCLLALEGRRAFQRLLGPSCALARHGNDLAGHIGRQIRRQEHHDICHFPHLGRAAECLLSGEFL